MEEMKHFDLESKPGKSPGGYNYPLYETGAPFIFMNSVGSQNDFTTMVHEGGHAVHSFLTHHLELTAFKSFPSEIAELASMSMELLTMDHWDKVYDDSDDLYRAKKEQIEGTLTLLPWIAQIDAFQHWVYENHDHSAEERTPIGWSSTIVLALVLSIGLDMKGFWSPLGKDSFTCSKFHSITLNTASHSLAPLESGKTVKKILNKPLDIMSVL